MITFCTLFGTLLFPPYHGDSSMSINKELAFFFNGYIAFHCMDELNKLGCLQCFNEECCVTLDKC